MQRGLVGGLDDLRPHLIAGPVLRTDNSDLTDRTPARAFLRQFAALLVARVATLPAEVRFVNFHRTIKRAFAIIATGRPEQMPCRAVGCRGFSEMVIAACIAYVPEVATAV